MARKVPQHREGLRLAIHIPAGMLNILAFWVGIGLGTAFLVGFLAYEVMEDWRINDFSYINMRGYLWGLAIGTIIWAAIKYFGS